MLLEKLTLCDFGVFRGQQSFDLLPRRKQRALRPIVLFGGLNGSGKTTVLTAVRLALYGRQALGYGTSQKAYSAFLASLIHRNSDSLVPTDAASVTLDFGHSKLGTPASYKVVRSWIDKGKQIDESLRVSCNGEPIEGLDPDKAQALLNQLVPPGIAQFFFFDGEKIADLASDESDAGLAESIKRLLGLDIVDRLRGDLTVYLRQKRAAQMGGGSYQQEIVTREQALAQVKEDIDRDHSKLNTDLDPAIQAARERLEQIEQEIGERGGGWARSRGAVRSRIDELLRLKRGVEGEVRESLGGLFPLSLAPDLWDAVEQQLRREMDEHQANLVQAMLSQRLDQVEVLLAKILSHKQLTKTLSILSEALGVKPSGSEQAPRQLLHDFSEKQTRHVLELRGLANTKAKFEMTKLREQLAVYEAELAELGSQLSQAPEEATLQTVFEDLKIASIRLGELQSKRRAVIDELKGKLWQCINLSRELKRLEESAEDDTEKESVVLRAEQVRLLLEELTAQMTLKKLHVLREHFLQAFIRLARKEDLIVDAVIDPHNFSVTLIDRRGTQISKHSLSAGEKQIYAIAMLEALARTSGRSLPVIIDTPLGRLDSRHRAKLVEHYFPSASHQVVILSTDTEVDQPFYSGLAKHVSHAYHLDFKETEGATHVTEGYFWRTPVEGQTHAAQ